MAEAETIYRAASERDELASLVSEMTTEHQDLASAAGRIPGAPPAGAAGQAAKIAVLPQRPRPAAAALPVRRAASGEFAWEYLETGPKVWRMRIGRARSR